MRAHRSRVSALDHPKFFLRRFKAPLHWDTNLKRGASGFYFFVYTSLLLDLAESLEATVQAAHTPLHTAATTALRFQNVILCSMDLQFNVNVTTPRTYSITAYFALTSSTSKVSVALAGIGAPGDLLPYARWGGQMMVRRPPTRMDAMPRSQPRMTWLRPRRNLNGFPVVWSNTSPLWSQPL